MINGCRELIVSVPALQYLAIPFLDPLDHSFTGTAFQFALNAQPFNDHLLTIDSADPCSREMEISGRVIVEKPSGIFSDFLANGGELFPLTKRSTVHCPSPSEGDQLNGCRSRLSAS